MNDDPPTSNNWNGCLLILLGVAAWAILIGAVLLIVDALRLNPVSILVLLACVVVCLWIYRTR